MFDCKSVCLKGCVCVGKAQVPATPSSLTVKAWRRMQKIVAVGLKPINFLPLATLTVCLNTKQPSEEDWSQPWNTGDDENRRTSSWLHFTSIQLALEPRDSSMDWALSLPGKATVILLLNLHCFLVSWSHAIVVVQIHNRFEPSYNRSQSWTLIWSPGSKHLTLIKVNINASSSRTEFPTTTSQGQRCSSELHANSYLQIIIMTTFSWWVQKV